MRRAAVWLAVLGGFGALCTMVFAVAADFARRSNAPDDGLMIAAHAGLLVFALCAGAFIVAGLIVVARNGRR